MANPDRNADDQGQTTQQPRHRNFTETMATTLTYGKATTCLLDAEDAIHLRPAQTTEIPVEEIADQVRSQLADPIGYPPLAQATIPDDRVVLAVESGIPKQVAVIDGALTALKEVGVSESQITVLLANGSHDLSAELAERGHDSVEIQSHDPDNEKETAFLGVSSEGHALRLNRELCEADVVLPITVTTGDFCFADSPPGFRGLYPVFSDRETINRLSVATAESFPATTSENLRELEECGRQLGVGMTLQVVPGPGGNVASILAGEPAAVAKLAADRYRQVWSCKAEVCGNLVIASLTGGADQQTWQNIGRVVAAAEAVLEPDGAIVICTDLEEAPGQAISLLTGNDEPSAIEREILRTSSSDNGPAIRLSRALERGAVYLRSNLRSQVVESLGITPLESDSELDRLAELLRPCVVLEEAQHLLPSVDEADV